MDIGRRLQELRHMKGLSQGDVEHRIGLFRCYVSRVENGRSTPSLPTLERWAKALEVELPQLFAVGNELANPELRGSNPIGSEERTLLELFSKISVEDKSLLISLAREMVKHNGERG